jgi:protein-disulfide isomerase
MRIRTALGAAWVVMLAASCSTAAQPTPQQLPSDVVATIGSGSITLAEVDARALKRTANNFGDLPLVQALYEARRTTLDEIIGSQLVELEAKALGIEPTALVEREIEAKVVNPTDADIAAWYEANRAQVQGAPLDQISEPIRLMLAQERRRTARSRYVETLKAKTPVKVLLEPPRTAMAHAGRPARGPSNAPIEIVEFSDFQCPFCLRATATMTQILEQYGDRIRLIYRHYPLPNHPNARPAAEASLCAQDQDKFWPYHDRLFAAQDKLTNEDLKRHAAELGLDTAQFNACFEAGRFQAEIDTDMQDGSEAGVSGTPAFFINGRFLGGAQPIEAFQRIIDEELARAK